MFEIFFIQDNQMFYNKFWFIKGSRLHIAMMPIQVIVAILYYFVYL